MQAFLAQENREWHSLLFYKGNFLSYNIKYRYDIR